MNKSLVEFKFSLYCNTLLNSEHWNQEYSEIVKSFILITIFDSWTIRT